MVPKRTSEVPQREVTMGIMPMLVVWAAITVVLIGLVIYRAILGYHEEDQLFLDQAEAALERENREVLERINRLDPIIRWLAVASGVLLLVIGAIWIYIGLFTNPILE
jgi:hypothetical protein